MTEWVLLTGASGRIGRRAVDALLRKGYGVRALVHRRRSGFPDDPRVILAPGDLADRDSLRAAAEGCSYVAHLAAAWDMFPPAVNEKDNDQLFASVIRGTYDLLEACRGLPGLKAFVYASTDAVYATGPRRFEAPIDEDTELQPSRFYAVAKIACETLCRQYGKLYGLPWIVVRICWTLDSDELLRVFGYDFWQGGLGDADRARLGPALGEGRGLFAPLCADGSPGVDCIADPLDIAQGIAQAIENHARGLGGTFNLAGPAPFRYADLVARPAERLALPWASARVKGIEPYELRNDRAIDALGYAPEWTMERMLDKAVEARLAKAGGRKA
ncbi:MAG TPA: NAD(P)-dependent oxidoreductase [Spirochaetales bacterium]|nr:NAD(P)-dependent oxidoreductase [Spirochaetales bacterium]HRY55695.1 NAD(P)-dependent oxidoreductase [Spirochaetia bacterium]HRZ64427.1 NAD(P)-dependent oxidoreductase [Spirochaetia bacterium]